MRARVSAGPVALDTYPFEDGKVVAAKVEAIGEKELNWTDKETGAPQSRKMWEWQFRITEDDREIRADGLTQPFIRGTNDTRRWCEALVGELPNGFEFDTDSLLGLSCKIELAQRKPFVTRGGTKIFPMTVKDVFRDTESTSF